MTQTIPELKAQLAMARAIGFGEVADNDKEFLEEELAMFRLTDEMKDAIVTVVSGSLAQYRIAQTEPLRVALVDITEIPEDTEHIRKNQSYYNGWEDCRQVAQRIAQEALED